MPDVILLDAATVLGASSTEQIKQLRQLNPSVKIVVHAARNDMNQVVRAIQMGANAWVWTPMQDGELSLAVNACFEGGHARQVAGTHQCGDLTAVDDGAFFAATSPAMRKLRSDLEQVASIDVPVLCIGEKGTGKEMAARWLHRLSGRANQPFMKVNCGGVPGHLLESELFGYDREAFTPANTTTLGKFEQCHGGTLFLDEITEIPLPVQARILDVIQHGEFVRLDGSRVPVTARIVGSASANLSEALARRRLSQELCYRLSVFVFEIPSLRERPEDIPIVLRRYLAVHARNLGLPERVISNELWQWCLKYDWPGNVAQLEHFAKRYLLFGGGPELASHGDSADAGPTAAPSDLKLHVRNMREKAECIAIATALEQTNWNRKAAADVLHISYKSLLTKIRHHRLDQQKAT